MSQIWYLEIQTALHVALPRVSISARRMPQTIPSHSCIDGLNTNPIKAQQEADCRWIYRCYYYMPTLLDLSTEVLIDILSFLPAADLLSVRRTCHAICDIVDGTTRLQYILRTHRMGVDDILPPDFPYPDRFKLLQRHEQSRNALQFNLFTKCFLDRPFSGWILQYILQGDYLIYPSVTTEGVQQYSYSDLCAATRNEELRFVHIRPDNSCVLDHSKVFLTFAVDHNLVIVMSYRLPIEGENVQRQLGFIEFTTGTPHPLSPIHTVPLPPFSTYNNVFIEPKFLGDGGDYILVSACKPKYVIVLYLVAWKTGIVTFLCEFSDMRQDPASAFGVIDSSLIALIKTDLNRIDIYRCEVCPSTSVPLLQMVCVLELPPVTPTASVTCTRSDMEWVPTSRQYRQSRSSRGYHVPFYSSTVCTIGLRLRYYMASGDSPTCTVIISMAGLLSVIRTGVPHIPWVDWGPSITHFSKEDLLTTAGPFWIVSLSPLTVRNYGFMRVGHNEPMADGMSSWQSRARPMAFSTKIHGTHWVENQVETCLRHRDMIANDLYLDKGGHFLADREWIVHIQFYEDSDRSFIAVHHLDSALV